VVQVIQQVWRYLMQPPPSSLVFYILILSHILLAGQVAYQSNIIQAQRVLIDYYVRQVFTR